MTDTIVIPIHKLQIAQRVWIPREDVSKLALQAYYFSVEEYDGEWVAVEIHGHADGDDDD